MDVAIRRSGVLLYTILQVHFPSLLPFSKTTSRRGCKAKGQLWIRPRHFVPRGRRCDTRLDEERDVYRVSDGHETEIDNCPALRQASIGQNTPR